MWRVLRPIASDKQILSPRGVLLQDTRPSLEQLPLIANLVGFDPGRHVAAVASTFMMYDFRVRLINDSLAVISNPECKIGILTIGGRETWIEAS